MRTFHVQGWLELIGKEAALGRNCLKHIKSFISGVFNLAKQQGYFQGEDPVRDTAVSPEAAEPQETYAYTSDEIQAMLRVLPETSGSALAVASFAGLRRGELQELLWENCRDGFIRVTQSIWEGRVTEPKTRRSKGAVPVDKAAGTTPGNVSASLWRTRKRTGVQEPSGEAKEPEQSIAPRNSARLESVQTLSEES